MNVQFILHIEAQNKEKKVGIMLDLRLWINTSKHTTFLRVMNNKLVINSIDS